MENEIIKKLTTRLECPEVYEKLQLRCSMLEGEQTRISVTGGLNVGKTSLINSIADTQMEESLLANAKTVRVTIKGLGQADDVESESPWMKSENVEIWELTDQNLGPEPKLIDYGLHFAHTDVCVMLLNTAAALSRSEMAQLNFLEQLGIPTLLVLAKADQLQPDDYVKVVKYVSDMVSKYSFVKLIETHEALPIKGMSNDVKVAIHDLLSEANPGISSRASLARLFEIDATVALIEACSVKMNAINEKKEKIQELTNAKKLKLSDGTTIWLKLQNDLAKRKNETVNKTQKLFDQKKEDIVRRLQYDVDMCGDVKKFWEKKINFELEEVARSNAQAASQIINSDAVAVINWLNQEIKKSFGNSLNAISPITYTVEPITTATTDNVQIADTDRMRIVARVGTAVTVIAAGTLATTLGIAGITMAVVMLSGIGAEFFMKRKQEESREKVKSLIPEMVEQMHQKFVISISEELDKSYANLISNLQNQQGNWLKIASEQIEKEHSIAMYNCQQEAEQLEDCMKEINRLSEEIQNA